MARLAKNQSTKRLTLELNETVRDRLEELRDEVKADSLTEVIRRALALYDYAWLMKRRGRTLCFRDERDPKAAAREVEFF
jgi:hypothetical protein